MSFETKIAGVDPQKLGEHTKVESFVPLAALTDETFRALVDSILVVIPHRASEGIQAGLAHHFFLWSQIGLKVAMVKDPHGGFVEIVRGNIERNFLDMADKEPNLKYLVTIDNDQTIQWDAPMRLAMHDKPLVSGIVCGYNPERGIFACFTSDDDNGTPRFPSYRFTKTFPGKGLKKVHQVGSGLCAIRRDVIETLVAKGEYGFLLDERLRKESYRLGLIKQGEDFSFCDKVRDCGFDIYVDFSVRGLHHKTIALGWPDEMIDDSLDGNDWKPSSFDYRGLMR